MSQNTSILLISDPEFRVDFLQYAPAESVEHSNLLQKTRAVALRSLECVKLLFCAIVESSYLTLKYSGTSFKYIVLGYYGSLSNFRLSKDFYLVVFKVVIWALSISWYTLTATLRIFLDKIGAYSNAYLSGMVEKGINAAHIRTKEISLDASKVPPEIKVDDLTTIFQEINFDNADEPGYMPPSTCEENNKVYSLEELKASLQTFINNVNNRVAFLGTPPGSDIP